MVFLNTESYLYTYVDKDTLTSVAVQNL